MTPLMLLKYGMAMDPNCIRMTETKGAEAFDTMEAAAGHPTAFADRSENLKVPLGGNWK